MDPQAKLHNVFVLTLLLFVAGGLGYWAWRYVSRPHAESFVLIVIDTLRADHLGAYGSRRNLTPSLDALAVESVVFENSIATSAWTRSSIASMLTSQFPSPLGVLGRKDAIPASVPTLAEVFSRHGYATFGVTTNGNAGASVGFAQGFDGFVYPELKRSYPGDATMYPAEGVTQTALEWLAKRDPQRPFFLFLHYTDPHDPYLPHEGLLPFPEPRGRYNGSRAQLRQMDHASRRGELLPADRARIRYLYAAEVKYCDIWIGKLIEGLNKLAVWDDLMLVVTADHGEGLWDHDYRGHGRDLYEEMIRVPLLVRYPGWSRDPAARITEPVSLVDLAPTFLATAGIPAPAEFRGRDLWPLIAGKTRPPELSGIYAELGLDKVHLESVRVDSHKLIRDRERPADDDSAYQLFDLAADPGEKQDLNAQASASENGLRASLAAWRAALADQAVIVKQGAPLPELSLADLESMKALGYLDADEYADAIRRRQQREQENP
jgi:arylsulfatase A-like enzyme